MLMAVLHRRCGVLVGFFFRWFWVQDWESKGPGIWDLRDFPALSLLKRPFWLSPHGSTGDRDSPKHLYSGTYAFSMGPKYSGHTHGCTCNYPHDPPSIHTVSRPRLPKTARPTASACRCDQSATTVQSQLLEECNGIRRNGIFM